MVLRRLIETLHPLAPITRIEHFLGSPTSMQVKLHLQRPSPDLNLVEILRQHGFDAGPTADRSVTVANHDNCALVIHHNRLTPLEILVVLRPQRKALDDSFVQKELVAAGTRLEELRRLS